MILADGIVFIDGFISGELHQLRCLCRYIEMNN